MLTSDAIPSWFTAAVREYTPKSAGIYAAQLLWQRGISTLEQLQAFLKPECYQPTSSQEFGEELDFALARIRQAIDRGETVTIWGDFDADGITSTAVLWSGLGEFLPRENLSYYIPDRLKESHGLNCPGIAKLAEIGTKLIITCDTGSTNIPEIIYAQELGIDVIITDHHTLPQERPPAIAIINPRYFHRDHPLAHLSGVAVAYKLIEALYAFLPEIPSKPVTELLDLVAIGLIADLVQLTGDCRYLAQVGIEQLRQTQRLGVKKLLDYCKKNGDRPTDISFGIAPRLNAISRIHGDVRVLVELLTSSDRKRVENLATQVELANTRRKALEKDLIKQVKKKVEQLDLSTTKVIVLMDDQWQVGILGLVAGRIAQEYGKPTILLNAELSADFNPQLSAKSTSDFSLESNQESSSESPTSPSQIPLARGSARSFGDIDLYELVASQAHLLHGFGGHPFAAGLSLSVENVPLFTALINQKLRQKDDFSVIIDTSNQPDLIVTVGELGQELWEELKLLEPCGMGNPQPKILIKNCQFKSAKSANIYDLKRNKVSYLKTSFEICDDTGEIGFPGVWWEHSKDDLPSGLSDAIVKLDYNNYEKRPQIELLKILPPSTATIDLQVSNLESNSDQALDWISPTPFPNSSLPPLPPLPPSPSLPPLPPQEILHQLLGIAKYLSRTEEVVTLEKIQKKIGLGNQSLALGLTAINDWGFTIDYLDNFSQGKAIKMQWNNQQPPPENSTTVNIFLAAIREEQFRRQYFDRKGSLATKLATIEAKPGWCTG